MPLCALVVVMEFFTSISFAYLLFYSDLRPDLPALRVGNLSFFNGLVYWCVELQHHGMNYTEECLI